MDKDKIQIEFGMYLSYVHETPKGLKPDDPQIVEVAAIDKERKLVTLKVVSKHNCFYCNNPEVG